MSAVLNERDGEKETGEEGNLFLSGLSSLNSQPWMIDAKVDGSPTRFKIDTETDMTVLPEDYFKQHFARLLKAAKKALQSPNQTLWRYLENSYVSWRKETNLFKTLCMW